MPEEMKTETGQAITPEKLAQGDWKENLNQAIGYFQAADHLLRDLAQEVSDTGRRNVNKTLRTLVPLSLAASYLLSACSEQQTVTAIPTGEGDTGPTATLVVPPSETPTELPPTPTETPTKVLTSEAEKVYFAGITESELQEYAKKCQFCKIYGDQFGGVEGRSYSTVSFMFTDKYISRDVTDPATGEVVARVDAIIAVTLDADRKPKLILIPVQAENKSNPDQNMFYGDIADRAMAGFPSVFPQDRWNHQLYNIEDVSKVMAGTFGNMIFPIDNSHFELVQQERQDIAGKLFQEPGYQDDVTQMALSQGKTIDNNNPLMVWPYGFGALKNDGTNLY